MSTESIPSSASPTRAMGSRASTDALRRCVLTQWHRATSSYCVGSIERVDFDEAEAGSDVASTSTRLASSIRSAGRGLAQLGPIVWLSWWKRQRSDEQSCEISGPTRWSMTTRRESTESTWLVVLDEATIGAGGRPASPPSTMMMFGDRVPLRRRTPYPSMVWSRWRWVGGAGDRQDAGPDRTRRDRQLLYLGATSGAGVEESSFLGACSLAVGRVSGGGELADRHELAGAVGQLGFDAAAGGHQTVVVVVQHQFVLPSVERIE